MHFQTLESRRLLSTVSLRTRVADTPVGHELLITGSGGDDVISVRQTEQGLLIRNSLDGRYRRVTDEFSRIKIDVGGGDDSVAVFSNISTPVAIFGGDGSDTLRGGSGTDSIYGGAGRDFSYGNAGNDTLVSIGDSKSDYSSGGDGLDSFWLDAGTTERIGDATTQESENVHRVAAFANQSSKSLAGQELTDPSTSESDETQDFSDHPLFPADGPGADDVFQGSVGDCYFMAVLSSVAKLDPQLIQQSVAELGDGSYAVRLFNDGAETYTRVDGDLPVDDTGQLVYSGLGRDGSTWAAVLEKAFTFLRRSRASYDALDGGYMSEGYSALGIDSEDVYSIRSTSQLMDMVLAAIDDGKSVTFATNDDDSTRAVSGHVYSVDAIVRDSKDRVTALRLRNPWGEDGSSTDGYIILNAADAFRAFSFLTTAIV